MAVIVALNLGAGGHYRLAKSFYGPDTTKPLKIDSKLA
jgi:hypothetical protein